MIIKRLKETHSSVDFVNHRYTHVQNCFLFICKYDTKIFAPPPNPKTIPTALLIISFWGPDFNHRIRDFTH